MLEKIYLSKFVKTRKKQLMTASLQLIARLKKNDSIAIRDFYNDNKNGFVLFAKKYNLNQNDLLDVYQDAIVALIENAKKGKIDNLQSSPTTYLFAIGKFMIFRRLNNKTNSNSFDEIEKLAVDFEPYNEDDYNLQVKQLQTGFEQLGEQCKKVLQLFYYEEKKLDDILIELNYTNKDVLKSQKSRCLQQLKNIIKN